MSKMAKEEQPTEELREAALCQYEQGHMLLSALLRKLITLMPLLTARVRFGKDDAPSLSRFQVVVAAAKLKDRGLQRDQFDRYLDSRKPIMPSIQHLESFGVVLGLSENQIERLISTACGVTLERPNIPAAPVKSKLQVIEVPAPKVDPVPIEAALEEVMLDTQEASGHLVKDIIVESEVTDLLRGGEIDICQFYQRRRQQLNLSLDQLADQTGLEVSRLERMEKDPSYHPSYPLLKRLAGALGIETADLRQAYVR